MLWFQMFQFQRLFIFPCVKVWWHIYSFTVSYDWMLYSAENSRIWECLWGVCVRLVTPNISHRLKFFVGLFQMEPVDCEINLFCAHHPPPLLPLYWWRGVLLKSEPRHISSEHSGRWSWWGQSPGVGYNNICMFVGVRQKGFWWILIS